MIIIMYNYQSQPPNKYEVNHIQCINVRDSLPGILMNPIPNIRSDL